MRERKKRKKIMKNETKLKKLEAWLDENNFSHHVPRSLERGVKGSPNLIITPFGHHRINVKLEGEDDSLFYDRHRGKHPVFIRDSETPKFVLEKVQNVIIELMKKENGVWKLDSIDSQISLSADNTVCRERYPTFETARQAADRIDDQAYIKEARFA